MGLSVAERCGPVVVAVSHRAAVLQVMEAALRPAGYQVLALESGSQLIGTAKRKKANIAIIDLGLPAEGCAELCHALRSHRKLRRISVVLMGDHSDPVAEYEARDLGATAYLPKPFTPARLLQTLATICQHPQEQRNTSEPAALIQQTEGSAATRLAAILAAGVRGARRHQEIQDRLAAMIDDPSMLPALQEATQSHPAAPDLLGDLASVPIAEMLQVLALQRQTGYLRAERDQGRIVVAFESGAIRFATGKGLVPELLLGRILLQEKFVDPDVLARFVANPNGDNAAGARLGSRLIAEGVLRIEGLQSALRQQSAECLYELLRWKRGCFAFARNEPLAPLFVEHDLELRLEELLLEGIRRVDEWNRIEERLPSLDAPLAPVFGAAVLRNRLSQDQRQVCDAIDGKRSTRDIALCVGNSTFRVASVLHELIVMGIAAPARDPSTFFRGASQQEEHVGLL